MPNFTSEEKLEEIPYEPSVWKTLTIGYLTKGDLIRENQKKFTITDHAMQMVARVSISKKAKDLKLCIVRPEEICIIEPDKFIDLESLYKFAKKFGLRPVPDDVALYLVNENDQRYLDEGEYIKVAMASPFYKYESGALFNYVSNKRVFSIGKTKEVVYLKGADVTTGEIKNNQKWIFQIA